METLLLTSPKMPRASIRTKRKNNSPKLRKYPPSHAPALKDIAYLPKKDSPKNLLKIKSIPGEIQSSTADTQTILNYNPASKKMNTILILLRPPPWLRPKILSVGSPTQKIWASINEAIISAKINTSNSVKNSQL